MWFNKYGWVRRAVAVFFGTIVVALLMWRPGFRQLNEIENAYLWTVGGLIAAALAIDVIYSIFRDRK